MGGFGSGRRKQFHITWECCPIDTTQLLKQKLLTGKLRQGATLTFTGGTQDLQGKVTETTHRLHCIVERYERGKAGKFAQWEAVGQVTLLYGVRISEEDQGKHWIDLPLVVTHPNYGGQRYWFLAPCCGRRVRVVYLPTFDGRVRVLPECRECLGLYYASQQQSYIDRHITYEKYLLSNYGYYWANWEYNWELKEHYFR